MAGPSFPPDQAGMERPVFSLRLTPEQKRRSFRFLSGGAIHGIHLNPESGEDGAVVFNFHFGCVPPLKMLTPKEVCEMLRVSRTFLLELVRSHQIQSFKMGRLRRFRVDDVLAYLAALQAPKEDRPATPEAGGQP